MYQPDVNTLKDVLPAIRRGRQIRQVWHGQTLSCCTVSSCMIAPAHMSMPPQERQSQPIARHNEGTTMPWHCRCAHCGRKGATVGCRIDRCQQSFHLPCAKEAGCKFNPRKYVMACAAHAAIFAHEDAGYRCGDRGDVQLHDQCRLRGKNAWSSSDLNRLFAARAGCARACSSCYSMESALPHPAE